MKRSLILALLFLNTLGALAQPDEKAPYQKFNGFPPINLLLPDSVSRYTRDMLPRNKAELLILFSPMCEHCKHETEDIISNIDKFSKVHILMVTSLPFDSMKTFIARYDLGRFSNITVAHDPHFFLIPYFNLRQMPFMAFYNRKKQLISVHEGSWTLDKILEEINK